MQPAHVMQRLEQLRLRADVLVDCERRAVSLEALVVPTLLHQAVAFAAQPIRFVLSHPGGLGQLNRAAEMLERSVDLSKSHEAQGDISMVLAHRRLGLETLADLQRLLVVAQSFTEAAEQQVDTA